MEAVVVVAVIGFIASTTAGAIAFFSRFVRNGKTQFVAQNAEELARFLREILTRMDDRHIENATRIRSLELGVKEMTRMLDVLMDRTRR